MHSILPFREGGRSTTRNLVFPCWVFLACVNTTKYTLLSIKYRRHVRLKRILAEPYNRASLFKRHARNKVCVTLMRAVYYMTLCFMGPFMMLTFRDSVYLDTLLSCTSTLIVDEAQEVFTLFCRYLSKGRGWSKIATVVTKSYWSLFFFFGRIWCLCTIR